MFRECDVGFGTFSYPNKAVRIHRYTVRYDAKQVYDQYGSREAAQGWMADGMTIDQCLV
jgi:hypothetical protein